MKNALRMILVLCLALSIPAVADDIGFIGTSAGLANFNLGNGQFTFVAPINSFLVNGTGGLSTYNITNGILALQTTSSPTLFDSKTLQYASGGFTVLSDFNGTTGTTLLSGNIGPGFLSFQSAGSNVVSGFVGVIAAGGSTFFNGLPGIDLTQFNPPGPGAVINLSVEQALPNNLFGQSAFSAVVYAPEPASFLLLASALAPLSFVRRRFKR